MHVFVTCKNYFCFLLGFIGFKKVGFSFDLTRYLSYSTIFYNVGSIFSTKYLMCFNGLEMLNMSFNNFSASLLFGLFSFD